MKIVFNNSKGGVGKSSSVVIFAQLLALAGYKVLTLDYDPQMNTTRMFLSEDELLNASKLLTTRFSKEDDVMQFVVKSSFKNLYVIPGSKDLSDVIYELYDLSKTEPSEMILSSNISLIEHNFDYILVDTSPFKSFLTMCTMCLADKILAPINPDNFSYEGLLDMINTISELNIKNGLSIEFWGVFITMADVRTTRYRQIRLGYEKELGDKFIDVCIRRCEAVGQSSTNYIPLLEWDKRCTAVEDYRQLIAWLDLLDLKHMRILSDYFKTKK